MTSHLEPRGCSATVEAAENQSSHVGGSISKLDLRCRSCDAGLSHDRHHLVLSLSLPRRTTTDIFDRWLHVHLYRTIGRVTLVYRTIGRVTLAAAQHIRDCLIVIDGQSKLGSCPDVLPNWIGFLLDRSGSVADQGALMIGRESSQEFTLWRTETPFKVIGDLNRLMACEQVDGYTTMKLPNLSTCCC